jgi:hypothetical protein
LAGYRYAHAPSIKARRARPLAAIEGVQPGQVVRILA